ncbi:peptide chain release factor N(5)-glutamine methyltransferase [Flavobacterium rhizosphaerae]|uniref:Release factor glutamine methyltransferase n=1 Tax=Flavobacterium rhizosphaerae TaxID=3163298 RepID=A0ABW8YXQ1_9FLAO
MLLKEYKNNFIQTLSHWYDRAEAERFFYMALEELKGWKRVDLAMKPEECLTDDEKEQWDFVLLALRQQRPIQYIFGKAFFMGLEFAVNQNTLIPRPETEELVELIIAAHSGKKIKILDIGTGSGCIAISLAKMLPESEVWALDVSEGALATAQKNADANGVQVTFMQQDILALKQLPERFDVIVSNPPYVRELEKAEIKANVMEYEPHSALFVPDTNPLLFYKKIAKLALKNLTEGGMLYFEINQYLGPETRWMVENTGFTNVLLKKDLFGNNRIVSAVKP